MSGVAAEGAAHRRGRRPLRFLQVAFAGPAGNVRPEETQPLAADIQTAIERLRGAGVVEARLLTGFSGAADVVAAKAWRAAGLGPIHAIHASLGLRSPPAAAGLVDHETRLDGRAGRAAARDAGHMHLRWIIGSADLLIVVWNGGVEGDPAGAAAVQLALTRRIPILWIAPARRGVRLIEAAQLEDDAWLLEVMGQLARAGAPLVAAASAARLRATLIELGFAAHPPKPFSPNPPPRRRRARAYRIFRRLLGGRSGGAPPPPPPDDLQAQPGFAQLTRAYNQADAEASELGDLHRSHQVILLGLAILAATVGSAPALWPHIKLASVAIEIALAVGALMVWRGFERGRGHQHWAKARRLAEDLRLERISWTLGLPSTPQRPNLTQDDQCAHQRRLAGLPTGAFTPDRLGRWAPWALHDLIDGQAAYHRGHAAANGRISNRIHLMENVSFTVLLGLLAAYLAAALGTALFSWPAPTWLDGLVGMAGAIVPAIGAAGLGLQATLALDEEAHRSRLLVGRLEALIAASPMVSGLPAIQAVAAAAIRLQRAQEDHWTDGAVRRRLVRGP